MNKLSALGLLLCCQLSLGSVLPPNNLNLQDNLYRDANIDEAKFNALIDRVHTAWTEFADLQKVKLVANKRWSDSTVNASANKSGTTWSVTMYGGLARRPELTEDALVLAMCHELGHLFGGYFFSSFQKMSVEGQSDYFATQACGRQLWANELAQNAEAAKTAPEVVKQKCDAVWASQDERNLCYRIAMGGKSLGDLLAAVGGDEPPQFDTPDPTVVPKTVSSHPDAQCRLDTYTAGALCDVNFDVKVIPGIGETSSNAVAEKAAFQYSCSKSKGVMQGTRPFCWFKPLTE